MEIPKTLAVLLLCFTFYTFASEEYSHIIPVENYETELQVLDEQEVTPVHPVKVIKITKTIAVKVPVPYPVKVREKVPYPVHVVKHYPVPVPQIVHVPQPAPAQHHHAKPKEHQPLNVAHESSEHSDEGPGHYQVQESPYGSHNEHSGSSPEHESFNGNSGYSPNVYAVSDEGHGQAEGHFNPYENLHGGSDDGQDNGSYESRNYDQAIQQYIQSHRPAKAGNAFPGH